MKRGVATLPVILVILLSVAAGAGAWLLVRGHGPQQPEISAYSHGHLTRVGPYLYCNVVDLDDCQTPQAQGELPVSERYPVQLSVPEVISRAPWRLLQVYQDPANTTSTLFRPDTRLAVTIPTVDPQRGRLTGIVVQLLTLVVDHSGELRDVPHAEWSEPPTPGAHRRIMELCGSESGFAPRPTRGRPRWRLRARRATSWRVRRRRWRCCLDRVHTPTGLPTS